MNLLNYGNNILIVNYFTDNTYNLNLPKSILHSISTVAYERGAELHAYTNICFLILASPKYPHHCNDKNDWRPKLDGREPGHKLL